MLSCLFLVYALLCTGKPLVNDLPATAPGVEKVLAFAGEAVTLPCTFNITQSGDLPTVEWSKEGPKSNIVFLFRDGCETHEMKNPAFEHRTSIVMKNLSNGDVSLRISNVQLSDAGRYQCMTLWKKPLWHMTRVELVVVSGPKLSLVSHKSRGVTLQCEASGWLLDPQIKFLDDHGNDIPADFTERGQGASGCCTMRQRVTLQTATSRVICTVQPSEFNKSKSTEILIPADCLSPCSCANSMVVVGVAVLVLGVVVSGLVVWLRKRCGKSTEAQKHIIPQKSDQSTVNGGSEHQSLLVQKDGDESVRKRNNEQLLTNLQLENYKKDRTILQLQSILKSQQSPDVQPTLVHSPSRSSQLGETSILTNGHNSTSEVTSISILSQSTALPKNKHRKPALQRQNSSPCSFSFNAEVLSSSSSHGTSENPDHVGRSLGDSHIHPKQARPQRRHSFGFQLALSPSSYSPLSDLKEESEA